MCLNDVPNLIQVHIEELEAIKMFMVQVSDSYKDYNYKIVNIAEDSDDENDMSDLNGSDDSSVESQSVSSAMSEEFININERDDGKENQKHIKKAKEFIGKLIKQTKNLRLKKKKNVSQTKKAMKKFQKIYKQKSNLEMDDRLKILK